MNFIQDFKEPELKRHSWPGAAASAGKAENRRPGAGLSWGGRPVAGYSDRRAVATVLTVAAVKVRTAQWPPRGNGGHCFSSLGTGSLIEGRDQKLPNESHLAFWTMQSLTRWPRAASSQAKNASPWKELAMPELRVKPALLPDVG